MSKWEKFCILFWIVVAVDAVFFVGFYVGANYGH